MQGLVARLSVTASAFLAMAWTHAARAEWIESSSAHFVVYTDDNEKNVRRFSEQLERYHSAMGLLTGGSPPDPSPSNRVTVYVVRSENAVRELYGEGSRYIGGFYLPRAGGSLAIIPKVTSGTGETSMSMIVLLHEYAHHFMISTNSHAMPRWYSEGGAEFFASTTFDAKGTVSIGRPAIHRAGELFLAKNVKAADLLDPTAYDQRKDRSYDAFYGKSWLLFHYLTFEPSRRGQATQYAKLLAEGKDRRTAALEVFGDFAKLETELDRYLARSRMLSFTLSPDKLAVGRIDLRKLSAGEAAMMPIQVRSRRGVDAESAKLVLADARKVAARFPQDPAVLTALAEAEYDAGNDKEAIAAADAALAIDPAQTNAYIQKGYALFRIAGEAPDDERAAAFRRARTPFVTLNRRENDHPIPLIYFFRSYVDQGLPPTDLAISGLIRAMEVAPFDLGLRMTLGMTLIRVGRQEDARVVLGPVANNPHRGGMAESAARMMAKLDKEPGWKGENMTEVMGPATAEEGE